MRSRLLLVLLPALLLSGCYHAQVHTGKEASSTVVQEDWAPSFIGGLVPAEIDVSTECPHGVATVERKFTFLNYIPAVLTLGIYLPQNITVTCAAGTSTARLEPPDHVIPAGAPPEIVASTFRAAARQAIETGTPVRVQMER